MSEAATKFIPSCSFRLYAGRACRELQSARLVTASTQTATRPTKVSPHSRSEWAWDEAKGIEAIANIRGTDFSMFVIDQLALSKFRAEFAKSHCEVFESANSSQMPKMEIRITDFHKRFRYTLPHCSRLSDRPGGWEGGSPPEKVSGEDRLRRVRQNEITQQVSREGKSPEGR